MLSPDLYLQVRQKEGRLLPDDLVAGLPDVPAGHALSGEWSARAASLQRLLEYVDQMPGPMRVLELGCGNGWLAHRLSALSGLRIWGLDLESPELKQAARLFSAADVGFLAADIFHAPFAAGSLDLIVVASAIQYFPDLPKLVRCLRALLRARGELHILDSPVYQEPELAMARQRTRDYYTSLGFPNMASQYFHHTVGELADFAPDWLYRPDSLQLRLRRLLGRSDSPFPWIRIRGA